MQDLPIHMRFETPIPLENIVASIDYSGLAAFMDVADRDVTEFSLKRDGKDYADWSHDRLWRQLEFPDRERYNEVLSAVFKGSLFQLPSLGTRSITPRDDALEIALTVVSPAEAQYFMVQQRWQDHEESYGIIPTGFLNPRSCSVEGVIQSVDDRIILGVRSPHMDRSNELQVVPCGFLTFTHYVVPHDVMELRGLVVNSFYSQAVDELGLPPHMVSHERVVGLTYDEYAAVGPTLVILARAALDSHTIIQMHGVSYREQNAGLSIGRPRKEVEEAVRNINYGRLHELFPEHAYENTRLLGFTAEEAGRLLTQEQLRDVTVCDLVKADLSLALPYLE